MPPLLLALSLLLLVLFAATLLLAGAALWQLRAENAALRARLGPCATLGESHRTMRAVLDHVEQGLFELDRDGRVASERSAVVDRWLGPPPPGVTLWDWLAPADPRGAAQLRLGWEMLVDDVLPCEVVLDQLPRRFRVGHLLLRAEYRAIRGPTTPEDALDAVLVVLTDETVVVATRQHEVAQQEAIALLERAATDPEGLAVFVHETDALLRAATDAEPAVFARALHTLKGGCGLLGVTSVATACHALEQRLHEEDRPATAAEREALVAAWEAVTRRVASTIDGDTVRLTRPELDAVICALESYDVDRALEDLRSFSMDRVAPRLRLVAEQAEALARQLGREVEVEQRPNNVATPPARWAGLWPVLSHLVRNAVDHGLETPEERLAAGKAPVGRIRLEVTLHLHDVVITVEDDGRGVDWDRIAARAALRGLPHATEAERVEALFTDGISSRDVVSELSGRGIGMAAVREAVRALGGTVGLRSRPGRGTRFELWIPRRGEHVVLPVASQPRGLLTALPRSA